MRSNRGTEEPADCSRTPIATLCCGCGDVFPDLQGPTHPYIISSPGCWQAYGELLARQYQEPGYMRVHQLTVDAYAVQHPGFDTPQSRSSVGIHLCRLCLILEKGWSIDRANAAMPAIIAGKGNCQWLTPPAGAGRLSVRSVLGASSPQQHAELVNAWARSVWDAWEQHHPTAREWCSTFLSG